MGIFNFFKGSSNANKEPVNNPEAPVSLTKNETVSKKISLRKEIVIEEVKKKNISANTARVVFALDRSGSMRSMYKNGTVQDVLERIFPIAMCFDDNSEMEFYLFNDSFKELEPVNCGNIEGYVKKFILSKDDRYGGTSYAPVMKEIFSRYAKREPANVPTFVIFITDGNNCDKKPTKDVLTEASKYNIFWKYIGIGNEKFEFLAKLDDLKGRFIDNANFVCINNLSSIDDRTLYSKLLDEYGEWINLCRNNGIRVDQTK